MRIDAGVLRAVNNYNSAVKSLTGTVEQLSSGSRLYRAANDTTSMVVNAKLRAQLNGLQQGARNAQEGINVLNVADGALGAIHGQLVRAIELATGAANTGALDGTARNAFDSEVQELIAQINETATQAAYATVKLLDGSYASQSFMIGDSGADVLSVSIADTRAAALGLTSLDLVNDADTAVTTLQAAITTVSLRRADLGAITNRLESTVQVLQGTVENLMQASARMADSDMAKTAAQLQRDKTLVANGVKAIDRAMAATVQVLRVVK
jgi:flagellin